MFAQRLLLDLELTVEVIVAVLLDQALLSKILVLIIVVVELTNSPVGSRVIDHFFACRFTKFLVEIGFSLHAWILNTRNILSFCRWDQACTESICLRLYLLLSLSSLLFSKLLVHVLIDSLRTSVGIGGSTRHLLTHHLLKSTTVSITTSSVFEDSLRFLLLLLVLLLLFFSKFVDIGFGQYTCFVRLPFYIVELFERFLLQENLRAICTEDLEPIINFKSFV